MQESVKSAHPEIFKVKMQAKKNVRTISTMSSSNYDNSDNSSNFGGKAFKIPKKFHEGDILTECGDISGNKLINQQELPHCSKDDEWMETKRNSEEAMQEYLQLIRDSPFLLKRSFLYNREIDQIKDQEQENNYNRAIQSIRNLFGDEESIIADMELHEEPAPVSFSPAKDDHYSDMDDLLSNLSEPKGRYHDNFEYEENSSMKDDRANWNMSQ
mmetsp:Transcript_35599/g.35234  ORF Transcript_35599/g.35234 Transcript_35599/m.35234 type:complete len:214 (+) Transcript_35599:103-744(+)